MRQQFLEQEMTFNLDMIESFNKRLRTAYNDFEEKDLDSVCDAIQVNLKSLYYDCEVLKGMMRMTMNDSLHQRYVRLVPTPAQRDNNALYQL